MWWLLSLGWTIAGILTHGELSRYFFTLALIALATADIKSALSATPHTSKGDK